MNEDNGMSKLLPELIKSGNIKLEIKEEAPEIRMSSAKEVEFWGCEDCQES